MANSDVSYTRIPYKDSNGKTIAYIYIPKGLKNTSIDGTLYYPGVGGYDASYNDKSFASYYNRYLSGGGEPSAFIALVDGNHVHNGWINDALAYLKKSRGIDVNFNDFSAHSQGGGSTLKAFSDSLKNNPEETLGLTLYDPYGGFPRKWGKKKPDYKDRINKETGEYLDYRPDFCPDLMERMERNGSYVRVFAPSTKDFTGTTFFNSAARHNIPVMLITGSGKKNIPHAKLIKETTKDNWQLYLDGVIRIEDIKNSHNYKITVPIVAEDGKVTWKAYSLKDIKNGMKNIFNDDYFASEDELYKFIDTIKLIESNRVKIDYDYLKEISSLGVDTKGLTELEFTDLNCASSSALANESDFMKTKYKTLKTFGTDMNTDIGKIELASGDYEKLEKALREDEEEMIV